MTLGQLRNQLEGAAVVPDPDKEFTPIVDGLPADETGKPAVSVILRFLEDHPELDLQMPSSLVHFVERYHRSGYEEELIASLDRRPTSYTVWMLNRLINGTTDEAIEESLVAALHAARVHPRADDDTKAMAARFIETRSDA